MLGGTIVIVWGFLLLPDESFCLALGAAQIHEPRFLFKESEIYFKLRNSYQNRIQFTFYNRREQ